jgi:flagellum-specific peptidoglycan hydrolase FlgJ
MRKFLITIMFLLGTLFASAQQKNTPKSYIDHYKDDAIQIMHETGVPASIVLGVAMHESACGNSAVAKNLNNQFGVKSNHTSVYYKHGKKIKTSYRVYPSIYDSFMDFASIMIRNPEYNLLGETLSHWDSYGWAKGIQRHHTYASSRTWSKSVLGIIKAYDLDSLNENPKYFSFLPDTTKFHMQ